MLRTIIRGFIYRLSFQAIMFIITLLIADLMGISQFGSLSLMIVNGAAFMLVTGLGTDAAIVWHASDSKLSPSKTFTFAILCGAAQFVLFIAAQFVVFKSLGYSVLAQESSTEILVYETVYILGLILTEKYISLLYGHQLASVANKSTSFVAAFFLLVIALIYANLIWPIKPFFIFSSVVFLLGLTLVVTYHRQVKVRIQGLSRLDVVSLFTFSGVVFITNLIQFVAYRLDFWLIDHYHGTDALGIYAQSNRFAQLLWIIPGIFAGLIIPSLRKNKDNLTETEFQRLTRVLNIVNVIVALFVMAFAWTVYQYFLAEEFTKGWQPLLLMLPGYIFFAVTTILAAWFAAKKLLLINLMGSTLCFLLISVFDMLLIPNYSLRGAAIANLIAYSITTVFFIYQYVKKSGVKYKDLFLFRMKDISGLKKIFADGR